MPPDIPLKSIFRLNPLQQKGLAKLGILSVQDLLYHFPVRYTHISEIRNIADLREKDKAVVYGKISAIKTAKSFRSKMPYTEGVVEDRTGKIKVMWFRQPYIAKMFPEGSMVKLSGTVSERDGKLSLSHPEISRIKELPIDSHNSLWNQSPVTSNQLLDSFPVYPETRGVTSRWLYYAVEKIIKTGVLEKIEDPIPEIILKKYSLPSLTTALVWIHRPKNDDNSASARKRFAFEEIFLIQLVRQRARQEYERNAAPVITVPDEKIKEFLSRFPFTPTLAQKKAIMHILHDLAAGKPMLRLLEGDVGSGKTLVAATAAYAVIATVAGLANDFSVARSMGRMRSSEVSANPVFQKYQIAYMAPTEILANQHFESFIKYFEHPPHRRAGLPVTVGLITGSGCKKFPSKVDATQATHISRAQLLGWVKDGTVDILFGTHALIQKSVAFRSLALAIIDEQHRFGTSQRANLVQKEEGGVNPAKPWRSRAPHLLSMTATPIPRTLALTIHGDLDLTLLDEMPAGRKPVITEIISLAKRKEMYEKIREELQNGRQVYIICPRIDEPDPEKELALIAKSVKEEAKLLEKNIFPEFQIGILHGKMTPKEKEKTMKDFESGILHILVATSVVEVGVNVENASVIVIEGAERFGLAQLHQLRGRVLRSTHQAYCFLLTGNNGENTSRRLKALTTAKNGFELSEIDLTLRGAGQLGGKQQWGISDLGMEAIKNIKMVEAARSEAQAILEADPDLKNHPALLAHLHNGKNNNHFE
ncbi:ATP-dependent DNA helicase RecG [bacterium]|nr:ATP-dependent DNA helicase RecG [bacterium]